MKVVIPTARQINLRYLEPLIESGADFIIVDDTEGTIRINHPSFKVYNWGDRKKILGKYEAAIPKKNGASRDLGFYLAWKESDDNEIIVALDDDCRVYHENFKQQVEQVLSDCERATIDGGETHYNILNLYNAVDEHLYPRGFPYSKRVKYQIPGNGKKVMANSAFNLGLWKGVFDINGIDKINGPEWRHPGAELTFESTIIPKETLVSVCSMNMQFRKKLIPAVYQLPMHVEVLNGWNIDRYGDIWGGFILKVLMDVIGDNMTVGEPMIDHLKEGNYERNIWQEHICHLVNDEMIGYLLEARTILTESTYVNLMGELSDFLAQKIEKSSELLKPYLQHLVKCMRLWVRALSS